MITITGLSNRTLETTRLQTALRTSFGSPVVELATLPPLYTTYCFVFVRYYFNSSIMAYNLRKGKAPQTPRDPSIAPTEQSTDDTPGPSSQGPVSVPSRSPSPTLTKDDIVQLMAQQLAAAQVNLTNLVTEQVTLAMSTLRTGESQIPLIRQN